MQGGKRWFTSKEVLVLKNSALSFHFFQSALRITVSAVWKYRTYVDYIFTETLTHVIRVRVGVY